MMVEPLRLDLRASNGKPLVHKYLCQEAAPEGLFFQLPGDNYGADGPLLYFPSRALFSDGWDTFSLRYGYQSAGEPFNPTHIATTVEECSAALEAVLMQRDYEKITLAGKSLGAAIIAVIISMDPALERAHAAYLTPPLGTPVFDPVFVETSNPAYVAMGSADRFYQQEALDKLQEKREFTFTLVPGADHSLWIEGDLEATLEAHGRVTREVAAFARG
jgi:dienelactone hydrolase